MKILLFILSVFLCSFLFAQNPLPAKPNNKTILIKGGTIHIGNGEIIYNGYIIIQNKQIEYVGRGIEKSMHWDTLINANGMEIYPGLIAPNTNLGLQEIELIRSTRDYHEVGVLNPSIRAIVAYNTDSKIIPTVKSNGVLLAQIVPQGVMVSGKSSVVQLDAWNWEDAAYSIDEGLHVTWPSLTLYKNAENKEELNVKYRDQLNELNQLFIDAANDNHIQDNDKTNLKLKAVAPFLDQYKRVYFHVHTAKEILAAISFCKQHNLNGVLVDAEESYLVTEQIKESKLPVILSATHALPTKADDDINQPYKTPAILQKAGILFCLSHKDWSGNQRNLPFQAGTAAAYGLTKEEALQSITLNTAKILGIDIKTGSIEIGKDANLIISQGDILNMQSSKISIAFIQGRSVTLTNTQSQLYNKYLNKYNVK